MKVSCLLWTKSEYDKTAGIYREAIEFLNISAKEEK